MDRNIKKAEWDTFENQSPPAGVAWIEITIAVTSLSSTREGGVDRNHDLHAVVAHLQTSPPARVAWIEMLWSPSFSFRPGNRHPRGWRG